MPRTSPATSLLVLLLLAALGAGTFVLGHHRADADRTAATAATAGGAAPATPTTRMFDDPRFDLTFRYPSELRPTAVRTDARERGRRVVASAGLYSPRIGYIVLTRVDDDLNGLALDRNAPILTRQILAIVRRSAPTVRVRATAHAINHLPVAELRSLGARREVPLNVFTWVGRNGYRLICHVAADRARGAEMLRVCENAMRTLAPSPAFAARPSARRPS